MKKLIVLFMLVVSYSCSDENEYDKKFCWECQISSYRENTKEMVCDKTETEIIDYKQGIERIYLNSYLAGLTSSPTVTVKCNKK